MKKIVTRVVVGIMVALAAVVLFGAPAQAAVFVGAVAAADPAIIFDVPWAIVIGVIVSTILPIIVGLVTKMDTKSGVRAVLLAALAAVTGLLTELGNALTAEVPYNLGLGLLFALVAFITGVGMHYGLWKPTTVSDKAKAAFGGARG